MSFRFPLATSSWDDLELKALQRVIDSKQLTMGKEVFELENQFASYFNSRFAIMLNSGSSANLIMTASLFYSKNPKYMLKRGDEIIVPAVSWSTTYFPLSQYGLHLKFVDIDLYTLNYDLNALNDAISDKTRAIMAVNLLGNPNNFIEIEKMIKGKNILLVEDNCESMGASLNGKKTGTFGLMGTFSCFFSHHISTIEGGFVITNNEELYHIMLALRAHGWTRDLPKFNSLTGKKSNNLFEESFNFVLPGYNLRPLEISGAIGKEQLLKLPKLIEGRRMNGDLFKKKLRDHPLFIIQQEIGSSSWFGFSLILKSNINYSRAEIVSKLESIGFECRPIVGGNFAKNKVMKYLDHSIHGELSNAEYIDKNGLFIGNHHYEISDAIDLLATFK